MTDSNNDTVLLLQAGMNKLLFKEYLTFVYKHHQYQDFITIS